MLALSCILKIDYEEVNNRSSHVTLVSFLLSYSLADELPSSC
jgi:hypothetical protein